jgi:homeobox protein cut-like
LQRQVSLLKDQLRDLRVSNESTEARLLDQSQRLGKFPFTYNLLTSLQPDQEVVAKLADMDIVVAELERANTRSATVERRNVTEFFFLVEYRPILMCPSGTPARRN